MLENAVYRKPIPLSCNAIKIHPIVSSGSFSNAFTNFNYLRKNLLSSSLSLSSSPPSFFWLKHCWNRNSSTVPGILSTATKVQNIIQILPYSPVPLKIAQVGNLENIICDLNEVTRRIPKIKTSSEQIVSTKTGVIEATVPISKPFPKDYLNKIGGCWSWMFQH